MVSTLFGLTSPPREFAALLRILSPRTICYVLERLDELFREYDDNNEVQRSSNVLTR
jgi:hypothetical protein